MGSQTRKKVDRSLSSPCRTYSSRKMRLCELDCQRSLVYADATFALLISLTLSLSSRKQEGGGGSVVCFLGELCECKKRVDVYKFDRKEEKQNKNCTILMQRQLREN